MGTATTWMSVTLGDSVIVFNTAYSRLFRPPAPDCGDRATTTH
jgi:hypothetical protein